ncbi:MAG TPA: hypothetical protein VHB79_31030 [Polyangiaceae bacterium]|nr:hypothetical protein [Polyangiaceae bacterium]
MTKIVTHGLVLWGFMFAVTSALYPLSIDDRELFGSVRLVLLTFATTASTVLYLRGVQAHLVRAAAMAAAMWMTICIVLDLTVLALGPPRFGIFEYLKQTGATYLVIPAIVFGLMFPESRRDERPRGDPRKRSSRHLGRELAEREGFARKS